MSDDKLIGIKRVQTLDDEFKIALMLSSEHYKNDARNHAVPVLDHFEDDDDPSMSYIVMPFLRNIDNPPFEVVDDIIVFCDQILEVRACRITTKRLTAFILQLKGLAFLHERGIAHR